MGVEEKYLESFDGTKLCYLHHQGKLDHTLVFLHGVGGNWTVWKKEIEFFQKKGYSTLAIDLRGHGQSEAPEDFKKYQLPYFAKDINEIVNKEKIDKFSLVGHSLGGCIAIVYCVNHKRKLPASLILVETATLYPFKHENILNFGPYMTDFLRFVASHKVTHKQHFFHFEDADLSVEGIKKQIHLISHLIHITPLRSIVKALDNAEAYAFNNQPQINQTLRTLDSPTLIIAGEYDKVIPPKFSKHIKKLTKNAKLEIMKAGHNILLEKQSEVCQEMFNFLKENHL